MHFYNQTVGFAGLRKALFTKYYLDCNWMKMMMIMMMIGLITVATITSSSNLFLTVYLSRLSI
jgi:NADH:ubiquinone oxidoreductase subunit 6 (subunit J)